MSKFSWGSDASQESLSCVPTWPSAAIRPATRCDPPSRTLETGRCATLVPVRCRGARAEYADTRGV
eukprot:936968-Amphidinium_carterae.1